jgi:glycosyltransferase involved in cell wall biosynthesis
MKGGVGRFTHHLVHALREKKNKNVDVHIATGTYSKVTTATPPLAVYNSNGGGRTRCNETDNGGNTDNEVYCGIVQKGDGKNSDRLLHLVAELKPDIVNIQYERGLYEVDTTISHTVKRIVYGSTLNKFYKECPIPTVSTLHTVFPHDEYQEYVKERALRKEGRFSSLPLPVRAAIRRWVMERRYELLLEVVRLSDEIISPARTIHEIVKRGTVIYHGAEPAISFVSSADKHEFKKEFGLPDDKRLLLAFGYVGSYKGFEILDSLTLPDDWSLVVKQNMHERGVEQPIFIKNAINLDLAYLDDLTLSKLFFACDAIIFPYKAVSISGVLFDALAHGLPFIASDLTFFKEFAEMDLGIACNRNAASFSESIFHLESEYSRYKTNIEQFNPKLRWTNIADNYIKFYSKLTRH